MSIKRIVSANQLTITIPHYNYYASRCTYTSEEVILHCPSEVVCLVIPKIWHDLGAHMYSNDLVLFEISELEILTRNFLRGLSK